MGLPVFVCSMGSDSIERSTQNNSTLKGDSIESDPIETTGKETLWNNN